MRRARAPGWGADYPVEVEPAATDGPVEFALARTQSHGSNDSGRRGHYAYRFQPDGRVAVVEELTAEWSSVLLGIEARAAATE